MQFSTQRNGKIYRFLPGFKGVMMKAEVEEALKLSWKPRHVLVWFLLETLIMMKPKKGNAYGRSQ